ncbi:hypothetical protein Bca101_095571 [Brassica carinata]
MARTSFANKTAILMEDRPSGSTERIPALLRLGSSPTTTTPPPLTEALIDSPQRTPALQRLGPVGTSHSPVANKAKQTSTKRKPGRPPGRKTTQNSPKITAGTNLRKRKVQNAKPPACRRKIADNLKPRNTDTGERRSKPGASQASSSRRSNIVVDNLQVPQHDL